MTLDELSRLQAVHRSAVAVTVLEVLTVWGDSGCIMAALPAIKPLGPDDLPPSGPDVSHLVTEDDEPVDNILSEKQQRLLTEPLYSSWSGPPLEEDGAPRPFVALANVGFFPKPENRPLVPDVMLSIDVQVDEDLSKKENRSYFLWKHGKPPDIVIEIVSNDGGEELGIRFQRYRRARVVYYVVYDPLHCLREATLRVFQLRGDLYVRIDEPRFDSLGLALTEWHGTFENHTGTWLRWCTLDGKLIPSGAERAEDEHRRAMLAEERVRRLEELLRAKGIDPEGG